MNPTLIVLKSLLPSPGAALSGQSGFMRTSIIALGLWMGLLAGDGLAVTFKPRDVHQWDTWVFHHDQTYYLYYLIASQWQGWDGFGVATSKDGVHWEEQGTPVLKRDTVN